MSISIAFILAEAQSLPRKPVHSQSDLPRFSYQVQGSVSAFLQSSPESFGAFVAKVNADLQNIFKDYEIRDKATERTLLDARLSIQELTGENHAALTTIETIRSLQEKPADKLIYGTIDEAFLRARLETGSISGAAYREAFARHYAATLNRLPIGIVHDSIKKMVGYDQIRNAAMLIGGAAASMQPKIDQSGTLDSQSAWSLLGTRCDLEYFLPLNDLTLAAAKSYLAAHTVVKPNIWPAREVTLTQNDNLHPVPIGIWDGGSDITLFRDQLYADSHPDWNDTYGLAYDDRGNHTKGALAPLTAEQQRDYPAFVELAEGMQDQSDGADTPQAAAFRRKITALSPDQMKTFWDQFGLFSQYTHGTHVAGIALRGNPAARLVVFRFNDSLTRLPFSPNPNFLHRMADNFKEIGAYCRLHRIRVVNMSWADDPGEFESWLAKTSAVADSTALKTQARQLFDIWKTGVTDAINAAPGTLFVCGAGNSNSDAGFVESIPASLHLPNLITVGAVDHAGDETTFTSYGATVTIYANGYAVESYVPGGAHVKESGTSMAAPAVTNLAAKLFALDSSLSLQQVVALIKKGASQSEDGHRYLINGKRSIQLWREGKQR